MSKTTRKPCEGGCGPIRLGLSKDLIVCPKCYMTPDESKHWGEMQRAERRLCQKYAKKRERWYTRMQNAGALKRAAIPQEVPVEG